MTFDKEHNDKNLGQNMIRQHVVMSTKMTIFTKMLELPKDEFGEDTIFDGKNFLTVDEWMKVMGMDAEYCDHMFLQLCAESMCKTLILVTVYKESSFNGSGFIEIIPRNSIGEPLYFLYYSESRYVYKEYIF